jgi:predicted acyltransferase
MKSKVLRTTVVVTLLAVLLVGTYLLLRVLRGPQVGPGREGSYSSSVTVAQLPANTHGTHSLVQGVP